MKALRIRLAAAGLSLALAMHPVGLLADYAAPARSDISDAALLASLPGFESGYAEVNGIRLHYVAGGSGDLVILLPGWPQTWWSFHKVMPGLAERYRVISVDIRGMGASDKPEGGYDKKTMASDIRALMEQLRHEEAVIVGHDIGAQVAYAFAANHPEATRKLVLLDVPHPDATLLTWPMLPVHDTFGDKIDPKFPYVWWFAFHQVRGLPEDLLEGRVHLQHDWFFKYLLYDENAIGERDRAVYAAAYNSRDAIRAGNAWYQAFTQDIIDHGGYAPLEMPVLGLGGPGYAWLESTLAKTTTDLRVEFIKGSGHFVAEEKPDIVNQLLIEFIEEQSE